MMSEKSFEMKVWLVMHVPCWHSYILYLSDINIDIRNNFVNSFRGNKMQLLNFTSILVSIFIMLISLRQFFVIKGKELHPEEAILISVVLLSMLNISIGIVLLNVSIPCSKMLVYLGFGSILYQSIISLFTIGYLKRNTKDK